MVASSLAWPKKYNDVPKEAFTRADIYQREVDRIFYGPEWHPIAHESEVPNPGDFKTARLVDVPLLVVRGQDNVVRVFYNSCSHRGNQLETAPAGNKSEFECPYHRWLFRNNGELAGCSNQKQFMPGFDRQDYPIAQPRTEFFMGLIFVTLSGETESLNDFLGEIRPTLRDLLAGDGQLVLLGYQKVRYSSNWKSYTDNDGYHAPLLHRAFNLLNWQGGRGRQFVTSNSKHIGFESQLTIARDTTLLQDRSIVEFRDQDPTVGSRVVSLFPIFVATKHLDVINLRFATPLGPETVEVHYAYFAHQEDDPEMVRHRIRQGSNLLGPTGLISMEDAAIFQRVHIGNHTPGVARFQKGVIDPFRLSTECQQNDETGNLLRWEYYRRVMGFERALS